ncbi:MAG: DNA oxidative demethylase AlkB [Gluconacetobacter diazotrophicus]|nr:DNA oxidative demethylase AlkB [Gluconacetobacter diazotrophicus]
MGRDLFEREPIALGKGAAVLPGFASERAEALLAAIPALEAVSPFRHLEVPGGRRMSVAILNCGDLGWVSDRTGYRYDPVDPDTGRAWPAMPAAFRAVAAEAAAVLGFDGFAPEACLVNRYATGARMGLHRDRDEEDAVSPIVSVSLGVAARFAWGGMARGDKVRRVRLEHGDVVVWGGSSRMAFHGVEAVAAAEHPATGALRYNLTFRRVRRTG